ncbi:MAG: hypothetical protein KDK39_12735 [Leptospiraceae bacterium]|nr:hypothetical protein [Leptospiraceae bacterium]
MRKKCRLPRLARSPDAVDIQIMIQFYWYPKCSTCLRAKKALDQAGIEYLAIDITQKPPSESSMQRWVSGGSVTVKQLINTSGQEYRKPAIKAAIQSALTRDPDSASVLQMLASNGRLIKRPILTDGQKATVGFRDPAAILTVWS